MKKAKFEHMNEQTCSVIYELADTIHHENEIAQRELIEHKSPYSNEINKHIHTYDELYCYCTIGLTEATVTRRSLIRNIDLDLWITSKAKTNRELMLSGNPPYAFDSLSGAIELHHIGQGFDCPFAELTEEEHTLYGNHKTLHPSQENSWRQNPQKERQFDRERQKYWKKRAKGEIIEHKVILKVLPSASETCNKPNSSTIMKKIVKEILPGCTPEDLRFLASAAYTEAMIQEFGAKSFHNFLGQSSHRAMMSCPHCTSEEYSLYGKYISRGEKIQRYKCAKCDRTFTLMNKTILSESNLSFMDWISFINCLYNGMSIEKTAELCHISEQSVHHNRLRIFYALKVLDDQTKLKGNIVIDETYLANSYKGNRSQSQDFFMDRKPHQRGSEIHTPGLSKDHVCIVCVIDEQGNSIARTACLGSPNWIKLQKTIGNSIDIENLICIYSDKSNAIKKYAKVNSFPIKQIISPQRNQPYNPINAEALRYLQMMNSYHSRLKKFISRYSGISSALLNGYLYLFSWRENNKNNDLILTYRTLFKVLVQPNLYKSIDEIANMPCFRDVTKIDEKSSKIYFRDFKRATDIFAKYASGKTITEIAKEYGVRPRTIRRSINKYRKLGFNYKTEKEKRAEELANRRKEIPFPFEHIDRNKKMYLDKLAWNGNLNDFYEIEMKKHGLSKQTIKNIISRENRAICLKEPIYVNQKLEYRTLCEVYECIKIDYETLSTETKNKTQILEEIAKKYGYTSYNIRRILNDVKTKSSGELSSKKRLLKIETINRDRAVFVDFLNWEGTKRQFTIWAAKKYGLNTYYVYKILEKHFIADPARYEMTFDYSTLHKE